MRYSEISSAYCRHVSSKSQSYVRSYSDIAQKYVKHIRCVSQEFLRHIQDKFRVYLWQSKDISKSSFMHIHCASLDYCSAWDVAEHWTDNLALKNSYQTEIWLSKLLTAQEFDSQIPLPDILPKLNPFDLISLVLSHMFDIFQIILTHILNISQTHLWNKSGIYQAYIKCITGSDCNFKSLQYCGL